MSLILLTFCRHTSSFKILISSSNFGNFDLPALLPIYYVMDELTIFKVRIKDGSSPMKVASPFNTPRGASLEYMYDSSVEAERLFECMIHPVQAEKFFRSVNNIQLLTYVEVDRECY